MEIVANTLDFQLNRDTAVAMGKFDGLHVGHRKLLSRILEQRDRGLAPCVFTLEPSPAVFFGLSDGRELMTGEEKRQAFRELGVEVLVEFPLTKETAAIPPEIFIQEILVQRLKCAYAAAGEDVSFGSRGAGDAALLCRMGAQCGYEAQIIEKIKVRGQEVSSTYVRGCVENGRMEEAALLLGTPYAVRGRVCHGAGRGTIFGMPTANLPFPAERLFPPFGVYFSRVLYGGKSYAAISNVGCKPTVTDDGGVGVETYLYDFEGNLYEEDITVQLLAFHRPEQRFESVDALKRQLWSDREAGLTYWGKQGMLFDNTVAENKTLLRMKGINA